MRITRSPVPSRREMCEGVPSSLGEIAGEIGGIVVGLESHQIVIAQRRDQMLVIGHGGDDFRRRHAGYAGKSRCGC